MKILSVNKNNHTLAHPGIFPGLIAVNISDAIVKKPRSLLIPSYFPCSPSGCKVPAMNTAEPRAVGFTASQLQTSTPCPGSWKLRGLSIYAWIYWV